ncbi:MAG: ATP phosphoribosyltransferase regulatory subunit [Clostridia bacterium]|nr:ATP phosphoribosyltransferase regulatory subunit [Clostridia bacterium]
MKINLPSGMRDWLPGEAYYKRELINKMLERISLWGYEEIETPIMENYRVLLPGESQSGPDQLYKLIDRDGSILALRPEMTTPIARVVSSKLQGNIPWRLMYSGEVFRYEEIQVGKQREFSQVGVELIGTEGADSDAEVLALAIETLLATGLNSFTISLGHSGVLRGLLESLSWEETQLNQVRTLILEKDFVGLSSVLMDAGLSKKKIEYLVGLLTSRLSLEDLEKEWTDVPVGVVKALEDLKEILKKLKIYGYDKYVQVDLSTLRSQEYYTGVVFEIYTNGIGYPIGGGGRYDRLFQKYGKNHPAIGFALGIDRIILSLSGKVEKGKPLFLAGKVLEDVISKARELRGEGVKVIMETKKITRSEAEEMAGKKGAKLFWCEEEA